MSLLPSHPHHYPHGCREPFVQNFRWVVTDPAVILAFSSPHHVCFGGISYLAPNLCYPTNFNVRFSHEMPETMLKTSPWNKGKSAGQKAAFSLRAVQSFKQLLANDGNLRDLAFFSMGIDTMLRGVD